MNRFISSVRVVWLISLFAAAGELHSASPAPAGAASLPAAPAPFTREQLLPALTRDLVSHFNLEGELQLELMRPWSAPTRTASNWTLTVLEYPSAASPSMLLRCQLAGDGVTAGEFTLIVRAALWRDAWVARQPVVPGSTFDSSLLEARRVDLMRERDVLPASAGDSSFVFARAIGAGRTLTWRDISRRPLVRKGELVEVSASSGALLVTMKALALENGGRGETISVRNPESHKNFAAVVVDEKRVQVLF